MIKAYYKTFISMQKTITTDSDFDVFAFKTKDNEYYLYYQEKNKTSGYISDAPIEKEKLQFAGDEKIFKTPVDIMVHSEIVLWE